MAQVEERALEEAEARGRALPADELRASTARYDQASGRVVLELMNGGTYAFPAELAQDLQRASPEALLDVQVDGAGFNLHWPSLDADLFVPALVSGVFGTRAWMTKELARRAGQTKSPAKAAAARASGARGGRSRKSA